MVKELTNGVGMFKLIFGVPGEVTIFVPNVFGQCTEMKVKFLVAKPPVPQAPAGSNAMTLSRLALFFTLAGVSAQVGKRRTQK